MRTALLYLLAAASLSGQVVTSTPASVTFTWQLGAKLPASQTLAIKVSSGTPAYAVTTPPSDAWLIATPDAGTLPVSLVVQVNPSTLPPGVYVSAVTITTAGVIAPFVIPVTLTITSAASSPTVAPAIVPLASPGSLTGTFTVTAGLLPATFTITSGSPWLTASNATLVLLPAQSQTITVTATPGNLVPQLAAYAGKITVAANSGGVVKSLTVAVSLTVNAQSPTVLSFWPLQIPVGSPDTLVTLRGVSFFSGTAVTAAGQVAALKTTVVSTDVLLTTIPAALLAAPGAVNLTVTNPAPGGASAPVSILVGNASVISGITNAASYQVGQLSPGEIIAIFGQNIGPVVPVQLTAFGGFAQTNVGGVTVSIDGTLAPIVYASASQVSVQVPYEARLGNAGVGTARVLTLTSGTATPAITNVDIVPAAPGIFTFDASGTGPAMLLNCDPVTGACSLNSAKNGAIAGTILVFFLTGEGDYASLTYIPETGFLVPLTPPVATGVYPQLAPLPAVTIGGVAAAVINYAGPIPSGMMGLLQMNVVVPAGVATAATVPLIVTIGGVTTQAGVTVALK
jgi:uncharacterized protein (TIGR03437 family)